MQEGQSELGRTVAMLLGDCRPLFLSSRIIRRLRKTEDHVFRNKTPKTGAKSEREGVQYDFKLP